ncbi:5335_t:CDS:2 [Diversispora eburnea]|uniref:5335_t:CDS:1 n=1 Tax=Diversispora eburnea TaxID=1213867 RepID=A0A9N8V2S1_9GLOM|nr:5335_t:CDS:2 [Diversispora eburnea]
MDTVNERSGSGVQSRTTYSNTPTNITLGFDKNEGNTQSRPYNSYQTTKAGFSLIDLNALVKSTLEQAKFEPEVVHAAAQLLLLSNPDINSGYLVDSSSGILDVASNRSSAMSLSNLLLPDDGGSSSKAT